MQRGSVAAAVAVELAVRGADLPTNFFLVCAATAAVTVGEWWWW